MTDKIVAGDKAHPTIPLPNPDKVVDRNLNHISKANSGFVGHRLERFTSFILDINF